MKATGIVRRIDDLGRVVIPKEIRHTLAIREGDPLEIYTTDGGVWWPTTRRVCTKVLLHKFFVAFLCKLPA